MHVIPATARLAGDLEVDDRRIVGRFHIGNAQAPAGNLEMKDRKPPRTTLHQSQP